MSKEIEKPWMVYGRYSEFGIGKVIEKGIWTKIIHNENEKPSPENWNPVWSQTFYKLELATEYFIKEHPGKINPKEVIDQIKQNFPSYFKND